MAEWLLLQSRVVVGQGREDLQSLRSGGGRALSLDHETTRVCPIADWAAEVTSVSPDWGGSCRTRAIGVCGYLEAAMRPFGLESSLWTFSVAACVVAAGRSCPH